MFKRIFAFFTASALIGAMLAFHVSAEDKIPFEINADSAVLMDAATGTVLYSKNADSLTLPDPLTLQRVEVFSVVMCF